MSPPSYFYRTQIKLVFAQYSADPLVVFTPSLNFLTFGELLISPDDFNVASLEPFWDLTGLFLGLLDLF